MPCRALLIALFLGISFSVKAQDWQTVHSGDTQFFYTIARKFLSLPDLPAVRAIFVENTSSTGTESVLRFPTAWRDTSGGWNSFGSKCIDPNAPSWMGRMLIHLTTGEDEYFNRQKDTIIIQTQAQVGDSWKLYDDHKGLTFQATIVAADTFLWGAMVDSFKTATIQAYLGTVAQKSYANKFVLKWSKTHGWLKTFDFYAFPRMDSVWNFVGEFADSTQHTRIPSELVYKSLNTDIFTKYQPGNEWVKNTSNTAYSGTVTNSYQYDSVISATPIGASQLSVKIITRTFYQTLPWGQAPAPPSYGAYTSTITVQQPGSSIYLKDFYFYDTLLHAVVKSPITQRIFSGSQDFCENYSVLITDITPCSRVPSLSGGCYKVGCIDGVDKHQNGYLSGFGQTFHSYEFNDLATYSYSERWSYSYIKLNGCVSGTKPNLYVSVPGILLSESKFYPNPVNEKMTIEFAFSAGAVDVSLLNSVGQYVLRQKINGSKGEINFAALPEGLYWLELANQQERVVRKIVVVH